MNHNIYVDTKKKYKGSCSWADKWAWLHHPSDLFATSNDSPWVLITTIKYQKY